MQYCLLYGLYIVFYIELELIRYNTNCVLMAIVFTF